MKIEFYIDTWEWALLLCIEYINELCLDKTERGIAIKFLCFNLEVYKRK